MSPSAPAPRRTGLVTGASRGIGLGIATLLAERGYDLVLHARDETRLREAAAPLADRGGELTLVCGDLAEDEDRVRLCDAVTDRFTALDTLVLAAGVGTAAPLAGYPQHRLDKQLEVNLRAPFLITAALLPLLRAGAANHHDTGAKMVAIASIAAAYPEPELGAYSAAKAGMVSLCQTLNVEEAAHGVSACAVSPAYVNTDLSAWVHDRVPPEEMIGVADVTRLVAAVLDLSRQAVVPQLVVARASENLYRA